MSSSDFRTRAWRDEDYDVVASWWDTDYLLRSILGADPAKHLDEGMPERLVVTNGASDTPVAVLGLQRISPDAGLCNIILSPDHRKGWTAVRIARLVLDDDRFKALGIRHLFAMPAIDNPHSRALTRWLGFVPIPAILMVKEIT